MLYLHVRYIPPYTRREGRWQPALNLSLLLLRIFPNGQSHGNQGHEDLLVLLLLVKVFHLKDYFVILWRWQGVVHNCSAWAVCGCSPSSIYLVAPALPWSDTGQTLCGCHLLEGSLWPRFTGAQPGVTAGYHQTPTGARTFTEAIISRRTNWLDLRWQLESGKIPCFPSN